MSACCYIENVHYQDVTYTKVLCYMFSLFQDKGLKVASTDQNIFCHLLKSLQLVYTITCSLMNRAIITLNFYNQATRSKVTTIIVSKFIKHEQRRKY